MGILIQCFFAFGAILAFSIFIEAPKKCLIFNGLLGVVGWGGYLLVKNETTVIMATFVSSFILAVLSHIIGRCLKVPVTALLIPGILSLVPGAGMYQTVYDIFQSKLELALYSLVQTIGAALAIAIGIFIVDALVAVIYRGKNLKNRLMEKGNR